MHKHMHMHTCTTLNNRLETCIFHFIVLKSLVIAQLTKRLKSVWSIFPYFLFVQMQVRMLIPHFKTGVLIDPNFGVLLTDPNDPDSQMRGLLPDNFECLFVCMCMCVHVRVHACVQACVRVHVRL